MQIPFLINAFNVALHIPFSFINFEINSKISLFLFFPTSNPQSGKFSMLNPLLAQSTVPGTVWQSCTVGLRLELQSSDNSCSTQDLTSSRTEILPEQLNMMSWNTDAVAKKFIVNCFKTNTQLRSEKTHQNCRQAKSSFNKIKTI